MTLHYQMIYPLLKINLKHQLMPCHQYWILKIIVLHVNAASFPFKDDDLLSYNLLVAHLSWCSCLILFVTFTWHHNMHCCFTPKMSLIINFNNCYNILMYATVIIEDTFPLLSFINIFWFPEFFCFSHPLYFPQRNFILPSLKRTLFCNFKAYKYDLLPVQPLPNISKWLGY